MNKQDIRKMLRQRKLTGSTAEASRIISQLKKHPHVQKAHTLLIYSALPDEVPTQEWLDELVKEGKRVLLPRVVSETDMELHLYTGRQDLQLGAYHILEPTGQPFTDYEQIDVAIIPGMAFDKQGHRLGRGKGYYDRFLSQHQLYKIGICYPSRLLEEIPVDKHDIVMDEVIS